MSRPLALWLSFLVIWAGSLLWYGGVSEGGLPVVAAAVSLLYVASLVLLKEPARLSRGAVVFLVAFAALFLIQLLPLPFLFPKNAALRATHGVGQLWPATADAFYTVRTLAQVAVYGMCCLLVLRLRQAGLGTLEELLGDLQEGRARIRVPLALKEAEALQKQGQWREARDRYASVRDDAPDPKLIDRHLKTLDSKLDALEKSAR